MITVWTPSLCLSQSTQASQPNEAQIQGPLIAFTQSTLTIDERAGSVVLAVQLVEATQQSISVEVAFVGSLSTALPEDLRDYRTQTITFSEEDTTGTTKVVTVRFLNDQEYEGDETAVFQLQNNTAGTIVPPQRLNISIRDNDAPDIVINELFADSKMQRNRATENRSSNISENDFIEFVNNESMPIDLGGWVLRSGKGLSYSFPQETVIEPGKALVLFSEDQDPEYVGGASLLFASGMDLSNDGDTIRLTDNNENTVLQLGYGPEAGEGQSLTIDPKDPAKRLVRHTQLPNSEQRRFSPGMKSDGTSYGSRYASGLRGGEGWRVISSPTQSSFLELLDGIWTQGGNGSGAPTEEPSIYTWSEDDGGSYVPISDLNEELEAGRGYLVYFFEDDNPRAGGIQGGFPKTIETNAPDNSHTLSIPVHAVDHNNNSVIDGTEGWNLMGNPFGTELSVEAVLNALESLDSRINANILVWDSEAGSGNGAFIPLGAGDTITPFQGFWVRYMSPSGVDGSVTFNKNELSGKAGDAYYQEPGNDSYDLMLTLSDENREDSYRLAFTENGSLDLDRNDAFKLTSLKPDAIDIFGTIGSNRLSKNVLPLELDANLELPIAFEAPGRNTLELKWQGLNSLPDNWSVKLIDQELDQEVDLRSTPTYRFSVTRDGINTKRDLSNNRLRLTTEGAVDLQARFLLSISAEATAGSEIAEVPESVKLNPNYPNPFNPTTTISYELKEDSEVLLSIWNIVGQKVVTLVDEVKEAGEHTATWNASDMPSGLYIAQLEVGGEVFIRKMTLIK